VFPPTPASKSGGWVISVAILREWTVNIHESLIANKTESSLMNRRSTMYIGRSMQFSMSCLFYIEIYDHKSSW